ncbi:arabinose operon transcriptional regulator AraC [Citrobacter sedlakii]|uniref:arabinose operon transcriptional regulator AraC n=1 Tax=Citrobacter sedlakii TaxID=67826 RepID=UPI003890CB5C
MAEPQNDPLLPGYSFNAHLVAGLTPIDANGYLDFFIDRPLGMKGYILNLTIRGEGVINNQGKQFVCRPGDILLFPPGEIHHYGRHPDASQWYHQWVYFRPRAYWQEWLAGRRFSPRPVFSARTKPISHTSMNCSVRSSAPGRGKDAIPNCWRLTCWNSSCYAVWRR